MEHGRSLPIVIVLLVLTSGCAGLLGGQPADGPSTGETATTTELSTAVTETTTVTTTAELPDGTHTATTESTSGTTVSSTVSEFEVKVALQEEYDPGTSFGMPTVYTQDMIDRTVARNEALADRLADEYDVARDDNRTLHTLILQFHQIQVTEQSNGRYEFTVTDGNSCLVTTIDGVYAHDTGNITETNRTEKTVPC